MDLRRKTLPGGNERHCETIFFSSPSVEPSPFPTCPVGWTSSPPATRAMGTTFPSAPSRFRVQPKNQGAPSPGPGPALRSLPEVPPSRNLPDLISCHIFQDLTYTHTHTLLTVCRVEGGRWRPVRSPLPLDHQPSLPRKPRLASNPRRHFDSMFDRHRRNHNDVYQPRKTVNDDELEDTEGHVQPHEPHA